ncbi:kinase-like domain-containing protein [Kickxella alabastrina]|uniref:kinase-like domain-containing protein n=1 Tax=Kickxella alabastrina TaxID=61397 RepID=UPI00221E6BF9|nr:kinase-like domain-containing protein [Kickxella alabastrina]KAI7820898.1 kinase-like domain-containing protein [Kickxella alabastrina]
MQLCQTTLEEFLAQRNTRIAEQQAAHALECFDECDALDIHGGQLIDPVLNVRLFRSIVEGVKYFHSRDGANVFLDIVYADSGGNPMSRSASGIGRPGNSSQSVVPFNTSQVNSMASGIGDVHADAWDAIDGGNLKERPGGSGDNLSLSAGSRKIDWDAVFECMVAGSAHNRAAPIPGFCLSTSSSALQRESSGLAALVPRHPLVTFIPRIGDFGLATKSTLGIRSSGSDGYAFIGGQSKTAPVSTCLTPTDSSLSTNTTDRRTSNVGTVTYAAPEQLCEQLSGAGYNEKADIYSLGIIFFELYYAFSTFMERIAVFKDLRRGVFPPEFLRMWPKEAAFILRLMDANPDKRLSAKEILALDMFDVPSVESAQLMREVLTLKQQLMLANQRNEELGLRVRELERIVDLSVRSD